MPHSPDTTRLRHMAEAIEDAQAFTADVAEEQFRCDKKIQFALVRCVEIVGEAAARLSPTYRNTHPEIPWASIIGMRNRLVHVYFDIDLDLLWHTVRVELPKLYSQVLLFLEEIDPV